MKVVQVNATDISGGAARAAYRLHNALRKIGIGSRMFVNQASSGDWTVSGPAGGKAALTTKLRAHVGSAVMRLQKSDNTVIHSVACLPSGWPRKINNSGADIAHLHWINGEMMSVSDIARIRLPVVWTLHDMWAFCGAEHYTTNERWQVGYRSENRPAGVSGIDLDRWVWGRKRNLWKRPFHIVAPSSWMADCVSKSALLQGWPVTVIPNPIDTEVWAPVDKSQARFLLGLPQDRRLMLFGAMGGTNDRRKGADLLYRSIASLAGRISGLELIVFGQLKPEAPPDLGFPVNYVGHLNDDISLRLLYNAADVMIIPSRQDNLPNTGVEAHACGTPVIAFDTGGLRDIVQHRETGFLATAFSANELAEGILWVLDNDARLRKLSKAARKFALQTFAEEVVARNYVHLYEAIAGREDAKIR